MRLTRITDTGGDWEAAYIDDYLVDQNHSINWWGFIEKMFEQEETIEAIDKIEVNMIVFGQCPESLQQFVEEISAAEAAGEPVHE